MGNTDDLLDPLRYNNLANYNLQDIKDIGGGVFTERGTLDHLKMLDLITKAYSSVHAPTFGQLIPGSSSAILKKTAITTAATTELLVPLVNEVYTIQSLSVISGETGTTALLAIGIGGQTGPTDAFAYISTESVTVPIAVSIPQPLIKPFQIAYPQSLAIQTSSSGTISLQVAISYCKTNQ